MNFNKYPLNSNFGDLAEETGIHIGDGSMNVYPSQGNKGCYTVAGHHIDDKDYIDKIVIPLIKKIYGKNPKPRKWSQGSYGFRIVDNGIIKFKNEFLGLPLGKKINISIPSQFYENRKLAKRLLRGFFSTDGSFIVTTPNKKKYPRLYMSNISKNLMRQIRQLLLDMGFKVSFWEGKPYNTNWKLQYRIHLNGFEMLRKWEKEIGFNNPKHQEKLKKLQE